MFLAYLAALASNQAAEWRFSDREGCQISKNIVFSQTVLTFSIDLGVLDRTFISLSIPSPSGRPSRGSGPNGAILLLPSEEPLHSFWGQEAGPTAITMTFSVPARKLEAIARSASVQFSTEGKVLTTLPTAGLQEALLSLETCKRALEESYGVDPAEDEAAAANAPIPTPILGDTGIRDGDYPADAEKTGAEGTTTVIWTMVPDGTTADCRVVVSSGNLSLDDASCAIVLKRIRYQPGPVGTRKHATRRFNWRLPLPVENSQDK